MYVSLLDSVCLLACLLDCVACLFGWFVRWLLGWLVGFAIACVFVGLFVYTLLTSLLCWLGACFLLLFFDAVPSNFRHGGGPGAARAYDNIGKGGEGYWRPGRRGSR